MWPRTPARTLALGTAATLLAAWSGEAAGAAPLPACQEDLRITASDGEVQDGFGWSLSLDSDRLVVGASGDDEPLVDQGSAYVFGRGGTSWLQQAKLLPADPGAGDSFGYAVSVAGDTVVVGAPREDGVGDRTPDRGAAYVFTLAGTAWTESAKLVAQNGASADAFGHAVAVSGDTIAVGATRAGGTGAVHVYGRDASGWSLEATLVPPGPAADVLFGYSIALEGDRLVVGAPHADPSGVDSGAAYVYERSGSLWGAESELAAADGAPGAKLGISVALDGDTVLAGAHLATGPVGATGVAYVFVLEGTSWTQQAELLAADAAADDVFGWSVAVDGDAAIVGSVWHDDGGTNAGSASLFRRDGASWSQRAELAPSDPHAFDIFGWAAAVQGETIVLSAYLGDGGAVDTGVVYVYAMPTAPGAPRCFGDGTGADCPCGNESSIAGWGCRHSGGVGMSIEGAGSASVTADDLEVVTSNCPSGNTGIFLAGTVSLAPGNPLFDGLECAGGDVRRFRGRFQDTGTAVDTGFVAQDPTGTYFVPGTTYDFQYWTRDVAVDPSPCGWGSNFSPAYAVTMDP